MLSFMFEYLWMVSYLVIKGGNTSGSAEDTEFVELAVLCRSPVAQVGITGTKLSNDGATAGVIYPALRLEPLGALGMIRNIHSKCSGASCPLLGQDISNSGCGHR